MDRFRSFLHLAGIVSAAALLVACGNHGPDGHSHDGDDGAAAAEHGHSHDGADDHDHPHPHHDDETAASDPHGDKTVIGTATIGAWQTSPHRFGAIVAGGDLEAGVDLEPAEPAPQAVRMWIGDESGRGSVKARAEPMSGSPGTWHAHIAVPDPIPAGSQLWVELETADGRPSAGYAISLASDAPLPEVEHTGHDHGHDHDHGDHSH